VPQDPSADPLPDAVVRYADHDDALIDLHLPRAPNGTLLVLVHGGFWKHRYDGTHTRDQARGFAAAGYLVATPEYRRVDGGGGWPTTAHDVEAAVTALPDLLAGLGLAYERAVMTGHSAGGHLALWLLSRPLPVTFDVVAGLAPVCDLARADELGLGDGAVARFLGGAPLADADPMVLLRDAPGPRVHLVHGTEDDDVPVGLSRRFAAAHPWAHLTELPGTGHFEFLDPGTGAFRAVESAVRSSP